MDITSEGEDGNGSCWIAYYSNSSFRATIAMSSNNILCKDTVYGRKALAASRKMTTSTQGISILKL